MSSSVSSSDSSSSSESLKRGVKRKRGSLQALPEDRTGKRAASSNSGSDSDSSSDSDSEGSQERDGSLEPEVLSHAAQRKLKKKAQKEANTPASKKPDGMDVTPKRQNSVWIGNLAFKTTEQALRAFFQRGVPGCDVTRVNLPTKTGQDAGAGRGMKGENRGFAYVDFLTKEAKEKAISLSEQNLDGRKLLIKDGDDFAGRPTATAATTELGAGAGTAGKSKTAQRILAVQKQPPAQTLFLGNLGFQATEQSIRDMIEGHMKSRRKEDYKKEADGKGEESEETKDKKDTKWLRKVRMGTFEDSGLCKGFAFVDFASTEDATKVLIDPRNHHLDGRKLVVEYASADAVRRGGGPGAKAHRDNKELQGNNKSGARQVGNNQRSENRRKQEFTSGDLEEKDEGGPSPKRYRVDEEKRERGGKVKRTRPGAALALAQREKVAIVPSSGKKIVF